jgi:hypothetical protein
MIGDDERDAAIAVDAAREGSRSTRRRRAASSPRSLPSATMIFGSMSAIWRSRYGGTLPTSRGSGVRLFGAGTSARWRCRRFSPRFMPSAASMLSRACRPGRRKARRVRPPRFPAASPTNNHSACGRRRREPIFSARGRARRPCTRRRPRQSLATRAVRFGQCAHRRRRCRRREPTRMPGRRNFDAGSRRCLAARAQPPDRHETSSVRTSSRSGIEGRPRSTRRRVIAERAAHHQRVLSRRVDPRRRDSRRSGGATGANPSVA